GIRFINQPDRKRPVDLILRLQGKLISKIVEGELVRRAVGDVTSVGTLSLRRIHRLLNTTNRKAEKFVDAAHPFCIASCEVIVGRHHVHSSALPGEPDDSRNSRERFALPGLHLCNLALRESERTLQLHVEHHESQYSGGNHCGYCYRFEKVCGSVVEILQL